MATITPFLWFDSNTDEAIAFYSSVFANSKAVNVRRNQEGKAFTGTLELEGQQLMLFDGGPMFKFNEAISLFVSVETQAEVDELWEKLSEGGSKSQCGWLEDRFGLSWQIVPTVLGKLMGDPDPVKAGRVRDAMLKMGKLDIAGLQRAYDQE